MGLKALWVRFALVCALTPLAAWASGPNVTVEGLDGKPRKLNQIIGQGKWVVFNIWAPRCPPCVEEMPELQFFHDAHKDSRAIVVGAAIDYPSFGYAKRKDVQRFVDNNLISFPILLTDSKIVEKMGVGVLGGTPVTLLYTPQGQLAKLHVGPLTKKMLETYINEFENKKLKT